MAKSIAVALFTRDLRVHDNPVLTATAEADAVIPLFVLDSAIAAYAVPNRAHFLAESLTDLDASLRDLGAGLVVRRGRVVQEVRALPAEVDATVVHIASDVSGYAQRRREALATALSADGRELCVHDAVITVVTPARSPPPRAITSRCSPQPPALALTDGAQTRSAVPAIAPDITAAATDRIGTGSRGTHRRQPLSRRNARG